MLHRCVARGLNRTQGIPDSGELQAHHRRRRCAAEAWGSEAASIQILGKLKWEQA